MTDQRALTRLVVVALVGLVLVAAPARSLARRSWPSSVEQTSAERAALATGPAAPSHLVEQATELSPLKVAVTWSPLLAILTAFAVWIPFPGRRLPTSLALVHRDAVRERPRVPRAPPAVATTS